jgi:hypothetical protein
MIRANPPFCPQCRPELINLMRKAYQTFLDKPHLLEETLQKETKETKP